MKTWLSVLALLMSCRGASAGFAFEQRCSYDISVTLDPGHRLLSGTETVLYQNNSTVALTELYLELFPNSFNPGTVWWKYYTRFQDTASRYPRAYNPSRLTVTAVRVGGGEEGGAADAGVTALTVVPATPGCTYARVALPVPLAAGEALTLSMDFTYQIPEMMERSGFSQGNFHLIRFHPRVAVFDDRGWQLHEHLPWGEFYGDFGDYRVSVTAPREWVVAASGVLAEEAIAADGMRTSVYTQANAHNFVIAADTRYRTLSGTAGDVPVIFYYVGGDAKARELLSYAVKGLSWYARTFGDFPYPQMNVVAAGSGASFMEYPGMTLVDMNLLAVPNIVERMTETGIVHEIGHNWWYGAVGNDEYAEAWLDEGLNFYSERRYVEENYGARDNLVAWPEGLSRLPNGSLRGVYEDNVRRMYWTGTSEPVERAANEFPNANSYTYAVYATVSFLLDGLEDRIGRERFTEFLRAYYQKYRYHHVNAGVFFSELSEFTGTDWTPFFREKLVENRIDPEELSGLNGTKREGVRYSLLPELPDSGETVVSALPVPLASYGGGFTSLGAGLLLWLKGPLSTGPTAVVTPGYSWNLVDASKSGISASFAADVPLFLLRYPVTAQSIRLSGDLSSQAFTLSTTLGSARIPLSLEIDLGATLEYPAVTADAALDLCWEREYTLLDLAAEATCWPYLSVEPSFLLHLPFRGRNYVSLGAGMGWTTARDTEQLFSDVIFSDAAGRHPAYGKAQAAVDVSLTGKVWAQAFDFLFTLNELRLRLGAECFMEDPATLAAGGVPSWDPYVAFPLQVFIYGAFGFSLLPAVWLDPRNGWAPGFAFFAGSMATALEKR